MDASAGCIPIKSEVELAQCVNVISKRSVDLPNGYLYSKRQSWLCKMKLFAILVVVVLFFILAIHAEDDDENYFDCKDVITDDLPCDNDEYYDGYEYDEYNK